MSSFYKVGGAHRSSLNQKWNTPKDLYDELNNAYNFTFDLACERDNCLCPQGIYHDEGRNSLDENWTDLCEKDDWMFLNPPYGKDLRKWVEKAFLERKKGANIVMLIPSRTDTSYWHDFIFDQDGVTVNFLRGRLKFGGLNKPAPFPSALIEFKH